MSQLPAVISRDKTRSTFEECPPVVRIQKTIFEEAAGMDASDIHIEPGSGATRVRYRVHGTLRESMEVPKSIHENLIVRIKVLAKIDISERRLPQDGHICRGRVERVGRQGFGSTDAIVPPWRALSRRCLPAAVCPVPVIAMTALLPELSPRLLHE